MTEKVSVSYVYRDIGRLSKVLRGLLILGVLASIAALVSGFIERSVLERISLIESGDEDEIDYDAIVAASEQSDLQQAIVGYTQAAVAIATLVIFVRWIVAASRNCHAMTSRKLAFTPGWSVGWYFIPIANLWKPYQAMRQAWNVSFDPDSDPERPGPGLLMIWWLLFLFSSSVDRAAFRQAMRADELPELQLSNSLYLFADALGIPAILSAYLVVTKIAAMQAASLGARAGELGRTSPSSRAD